MVCFKEVITMQQNDSIEKNYRFYCEKCGQQDYQKNNVCEMYVFFDNGDFFKIRGSEVINLKVNTYNKLVRYKKGFSPVVKSGFIKTQICSKKRFSYDKSFLADETGFKTDRKSYIEERCQNDFITAIWLFDSNYWHRTLLGNIRAKLEDGYLIFEFLPNELLRDDPDANSHYVFARNPKKEDVFKIHLDFENCEGIDVYNSEISELNLKFYDTLEWSGEYHRIVSGGYMIIKFNKDLDPRDCSLFEVKNPKSKDFTKRLCGKSGESTHDICHLYVDYHHAGYGNSLEECFEVEDVYCYAHANTDIGDGEDLYKTDDLDDDFDDDDDNGDDYIYIGGYAKRLKDSSIVIAFGRNAETTVQKICAR